MKLYGLEKKDDLQKLHKNIEKVMTKIFDADTALGIFAIRFKTKNMKEILLNKSLTIQKVGIYLYDMNLKIASHIRKIDKINKKKRKK